MKALLDRLVYGMNKYYGEQKGPAMWAGKKLSKIQKFKKLDINQYMLKGDITMVNLFGTLEMCGLELKNHFFRSATSERKATEDGHLTKEVYKIYEELAEGGIGSIITSYTYVCKDEHPQPRMLGIYDDNFIEDYLPLTKMIHEHGTKIIMQIVYGASFQMGVPENRNVWGPSAIVNPKSGIVPIEISKNEIQTLIGYFADAALQVKKSGFDGVQIHSAHRHLFSQFLSPNFNKRTDEYGGSIENRARIITETYEAVREKVGSDYPVMIKINSSDDVEGGLTYEDSLKVSIILA